MIRWPKHRSPADMKAEQAIDASAVQVPERVQMWLVTRTCDVTGQLILLYRGPDLAAAKEFASSPGGGTVHDGGMVWPPPAQAKLCRCRGDVEKQQRCHWGHITECHYPLTCADADCGWINSYVEGDHDPLAEMVMVVDSDRQFRDSPEAGNASCACSRCGKLIAAGDVPVRCRDLDGGEWRYHPECLTAHSST